MMVTKKKRKTLTVMDKYLVSGHVDGENVGNCMKDQAVTEQTCDIIPDVAIQQVDGQTGNKVQMIR